MATSVSKMIEQCQAVPAIYNGIYIHNPNNIEAHRINYHLLNDFKGLFDISYNARKMTWISNNLSVDESNRIELLTVHSYDTLISERHQDRSMKGVRILNIQQKNLHSLSDYVDVLLSLLRIENILEYLKRNIIPICADWPGQLFIRKAITKIINQEKYQNICEEYKIIKNFVPLIGPLHVSLNSREHIVLIHCSQGIYQIWEY